MKFNTEKYMSFLMNMMTKIQKNRVLQGISKGFLMALPIVIMGSFALIITIIPIDPWKEFIVQSGIGSALSVAMKFTTNFVAVIYCFCIAYCSAKEFETSEGICGLLAVVAFFILTPFEVKTGNITMTWLGSQGLFVAMIVAIMTVVIYKYITVHGWTIKMPESVPAFVSNSFKNIVPGIVILSLYTIINALFSLTTYGHVHQFIYTLVQIPLQNIGGGIFAMILMAFLCQIVWVFGIHASAVVALVQPIWQAMDAAQLAQTQAGVIASDLPNILGQQFWSIYTDGTILPLAFVLILFARSNRYKVMGKVGIIPSIFNVSEPLVFGLPIVLNPLFAIPFVLYKPICVIVAYIATSVGLVPKIMGINIPFGTPYIISGFMQGGWRIALLQIVLIIIGILIYLPFFKVADKIAIKEETAK